jgi:SAM-dependent methyltransferase
MDANNVRADFDRLALLDSDEWNHNNHYHGYLLRHVPSPCAESLEIGCGAGGFARLLAQRSTHVTAVDLSPQMIAAASARSGAVTNIAWQVGDALTMPLAANTCDCIASIATLHHMPLEIILHRLKEALRPGGVLLILDLYQGEGLPDLARSALALPASIIMKLIRTGRLRQSKAVREAWEVHGRTDRYMRVSDIRRLCVDQLPGARIRKHLFWRYSLIWTKYPDNM